MDEKLRRWLESRCRARPDGTWLVEVPVVRAVPAPAFVLPDEPTREEYLSRAARVGRVHLTSDFLYIAGFFPIQSWLLVAPQIGLSGGHGWQLAALFCVLAVVLAVVLWRHSAAGREDERLRAWLQHVGRGAPLDAEPMEKRPWARGWWGRFWSLKRCRPGWMVAAESAVFCALAASLIVSSFGLGMPHECRKALAAWWGAGASAAALSSGCFGVGSWSMLLFAVLLPAFVTATLLLAFVAATSWDWLRWNKDGA